jgi:2-octaprenyl-6-methoxyphenol hydroxylase
MTNEPRRIAIVGAGPVGLSLALLLAQRAADWHVSVFDARPLDKDVGGDARTLALALGSVQLLQRLNAWDANAAQPITTVHVSQQPPTAGLPASLPIIGGHDASVTMRAIDLAVPMLGAVLPYGALVAPLQAAWLRAVHDNPTRCAARFGATVKGLMRSADGRVELTSTRPLLADAPADAAATPSTDTDTAETFDLAVVAEGGVFADQARKALTHDYAQTAWVGSVWLDPATATPGLAIERFTRHGPAALLPLPRREGEAPRAALVWCVSSHDDPVRALDDEQRVAVLNTIFPLQAGRITGLVAPLKEFALGLNAERTLVDRDALIVRIGNAAQTLHPVAGQGLNLGLRDAYALAEALRAEPDATRALRRQDDIRRALRRVEWQRAPDRWALIAGTDFLARSFTWTLPGMAAARGTVLAVLDRVGPLKGLLARQMMFGRR